VRSSEAATAGYMGCSPTCRQGPCLDWCTGHCWTTRPRPRWM